MAGPMATGCVDLKQLGHLKSGFYTVKSPFNHTLVTVYCDFTNTTSMVDGDMILLLYIFSLIITSIVYVFDY